jgi:hypothetical protein
MTTQDTLSRFITSRGIRLRAVEAQPTGEDEERDLPGGTHWACTLTRALAGSGELHTPFHQGSAHRDAPTAADVLGCLILDAQMVDDAGDRFDFMAELGYIDGTAASARRGSAAYDGCQQEAADLRRWLGADYAAALELDTDA